MSKGLKKRYAVLLIALVIILLASLLYIFIKLGISSYEEFIVSDESKMNEVKVTSKNFEDIVIDKDLDSDEFKSNLYVFYEDGRWGFKNSYGEVIIKPKYSYTDKFSEGLVPIYMDGKYGYIDSKENVIIKGKYDRASNFKNGIAIVNLDDDKEGVIDKEGNELFITEDYRLYSIEGEYILASEKNNKYQDGIGYLNKKGEKVGELKYNSIYEFKDGYAKVEADGKYGFINEKGDEVIPLVYNNIKDFSEGYALLIDSNGNTLIDKSLRVVELDNISFDRTYYSYINGIIIGYDLNTLEAVILNNEFEEVSRIPYDYCFAGLYKSNTLAFYNLDDDASFMDIYGNVKFEINNVKDINLNTSEDYFIIEKMGKKKGYGVVDAEGKEIIPFKYSDIEEKNGFFICTDEGIFNDKIDIYYGNKKINDKSMKLGSAYAEGDGMLSVEENSNVYYLNKYGQKFLRSLR